ncbi:MAG: hypothetical protein IPJ31_12710 [Bacteroidetes bacterium]|nr:hypothetical protein [Bacteroidota bacterium]
MNRTIFIISVFGAILLAFSCSTNSDTEMQQSYNKVKSKNISGTFWFSENLDSSGRFYHYDFYIDGTYRFISEIPKEGVAVMGGNYKFDDDKLYLDDDTLLYKFINLDTILLEGGHPEKYKLFRKILE